PAEAPIAKVKDRYRFQTFVRSYSSLTLRRFLSEKRVEFGKQGLLKGGIRISVDIDPSSML
ncbi:hypothetical protein J7M28_07410, partial [bacterium]|nr:hypothetical protein [bacterium]